MAGPEHGPEFTRPTQAGPRAHQWIIDPSRFGFFCKVCRLGPLECLDINVCPGTREEQLRQAVREAYLKHAQACIKYRTEISDRDGIITLQMTQDIGGITRKLAAWSINTMDKQVRAALVALGWTPPPG